jgi:capsular exopolysaccharide synthesis family protein
MAEPLEIDEHLVSLLAPASYEAEQYRTLADAIELRHKDSGLHVLAVTSPRAGDGKTTTAINLARTLARAPGARVLLVCADLRKPAVMESLGMAGTDAVGLVNAILDPALTLNQAVQHLQRFNLSILPAGPCPDDPYEVLKSPRLGQLLEEARQQYDYVVLDTPPLVIVPDCRIIAKCVDGFLLVVAAHKTPRKLLEEALNLLDPLKVIGLVFNEDDHLLAGDYHKYYALSARRSPNGNKGGGWRRIVKRVSGVLPMRRSYRSEGDVLVHK